MARALGRWHASSALRARALVQARRVLGAGAVESLRRWRRAAQTERAARGVLRRWRRQDLSRALLRWRAQHELLATAVVQARRVLHAGA
eukprot:2406157-Prymnesium_polylepis.1